MSFEIRMQDNKRAQKRRIEERLQNMSNKVFVPEGEKPPASQIGATLEALAATIAARRNAGEESYTFRLINGKSDKLLKKVMEEAGEVALAAKDLDRALDNANAHKGSSHVSTASKDSMEAKADKACDHLRYEAADVVYHLLVVLEKYGIDLDEFAAELNTRMTEDERPAGGMRIVEEHVNRG